MQAFIKKIILATDFSDTSKVASYHALLLAKTHKADLIVLHVFDTSAWYIPSNYYLAPAGPEGFSGFIEGFDEAKQRGKETLAELAKSFDMEVETIFTEGDPAHEIISVAEKISADLIVLGTHGYSGWKKFTLGSVADLVVKHAPCAVLTIKPKQK